MIFIYINNDMLHVLIFIVLVYSEFQMTYIRNCMKQEFDRPMNHLVRNDISPSNVKSRVSLLLPLCIFHFITKSFIF